MKKLLVIVFVMHFAQVQAQVRMGEKEACLTAKRFLQENTKLQNPTIALSEVIGSRQSSQANLYVFSIEPRGFVIVSALDDILAYSLLSDMPSSEALPDHISYWINLYNEATDRLITHPEQRKEATRNQTTVEPLLTSSWGQGCYHNTACPVYNAGPCHHVEAGCVAIAMAQIMYYHKYPSKGTGRVTYTCSSYGDLSANFGNTYYKWDDMADTLHENNPAVATLVYHCGVSVKMRYSSNGSGAFTQDVPDALHQYFYYPSASLSKRDTYNDEAWQRIIKSDLDRQHPVYYAGKSSLGSHAFVCDGYDGNGMFHFNFGWDGVADGYYTLASPYGFAENQSIVHDIYPIDEIPIQSDSHGIIHVAPDGTGNGSSWAQATSALQLALFKSTMDNSSIWVKEGTYTGKPEENFAFTALFKCKLYGGFKGDEAYDYDLSQRDFEAHPSILDGSQKQGVIGEISNNDSLVIIDGFTIRNGNAMHGGGIRLESNMQIRNCKFCNNHASSSGGAASQRSIVESRNILVEDCEFFDNEASYGGAIADFGNTTFFRCVFHDNHAQNSGGAVRSISHGSPSRFINCIFRNNTAQKGGGIAVSDKQGPTFWSCLVNNNTAEVGGGCYLTQKANFYNCTIVKNEGTKAYGGIYSDSQANIRNCIVWGNTSPNDDIQIGPLQTHNHCAVQNDLSGKENNFSATPENDGNSADFYIRFINPDITAGSTGFGGDWRLQSNSLCINRGYDIANQPEFDLGGNPRLMNGNVDIGAYETNTATQFIEAYFCEEDPYYYQDSLIPGIGYYSFHYPDNLDDSLVVIHMSNPPSTVFHTEEICENETFDFFGTPIAEAGVHHKTIDCVTHELSLSIKPLASSYMQEEICDGETFNFLGAALNEAGTYYDTVDCIAYRLYLDIKPSPIFHMEEVICEGETYNFFGRSLRYGGHYSKEIDCQHYELDLNINPKPALRCSSDTLVHYGNPTILVASGADAYLWSTGDTTACITIFPKENKAYSVTGFSDLGCRSTAIVNVSIDFSGDGTSEDEIVMYPNPANDKVEIYSTLIDEVEVYNPIGECIERIMADRKTVILDVSQYANGVYIIHVSQLNNHNYKRLIVSH